MPVRIAIICLTLVLTAGVPGVGFAADDSPTPAKLEFFEAKVRPLLANRCYKCHSAEVAEPKGHMRADSRQGLLDGGDSGPAIEPGEPDSSYLMEAVSYENVDVRMPPKGKLPADEIAILKQWIADGAAWPAEQPKTAAVAKVFNLAERKASHWCWQPVKPQATPLVNGRDWVRDPIDAFILAKLEAASLTPAAPASRSAWIRRVTFDLVGLPPSPDDVAAFVADASPEAYEKVVDHLLASSHYGERWARHWLDLVRYAETFGHEFDFPIFEPWRYRDYVIRAFNADVPYDQFVTEHVAGDLMLQPRLHPTDGTNESIIGTGFWFLHEQTHAPVDALQHQADRIDNQIDVMGKTFLGLTLGCARCHDHKFDAISTKDVYSLWGFMQSSRTDRAALDPQGKIAEGVEQLKTDCRQGDEVLASFSAPSSDESAGAPPESSTDANESLVFETFDRAGFDSWFASGPAFGAGPTQPGQWDSFARKPQWASPGIAHSGMLAQRLSGTLRSKSFTISHDQVWVRAAGRKSRVRVVIDGYIMDDHNSLLFKGLILNLDDDEYRWHAIDGDLRRYRGHRAYLEIVDNGEGYAAVDEIVFANAGPPDRKPATAPPLTVDASAESKLNELVAELDRLAAALPQQVQVLAMADGDAIDQQVYVRGSPKNPGEVAPRRFLEAIDGPDQPTFDPRGSGRLELARRIVDPANPLTARVMVNRIWHHLFGSGIVGSTDNFGVLGQLPTHPELLDHLADRFVREGWSVKRLIRAIVLSNTYRMASTASEAARQTDPQNRLLSHMPVRRLQAEAIRDEILAVSGRLDRTTFGPSILVHLTDFMQGRGRPGKNGHQDGQGRRSIYLEIRRNFLSPMMLAFDAPIPFATVGTRSVSNVPAQALILMNDPFMAVEAQRWAEKMIVEESSSAESRISRMYQIAFAREPKASEITRGLAFVVEQSKQYGTPSDAMLRDTKAWADFAHVLFNTKEFIFIE